MFDRSSRPPVERCNRSADASPEFALSPRSGFIGEYGSWLSSLKTSSVINTRLAQSQLKSPYLKAMVPFMDVSDKFTSAIARIVTTGEPYEDEIELVGLQRRIKRWRKKECGEYTFPHQGRWTSELFASVPSWAILLHLRAVNAHNMLLRPFFFFSTRLTAASRANLEPAVSLLSETINTISDLDQMTEIYRQKRPFFVHLLISACALLALVSAHIAQHQSSLQDHLLVAITASMEQSFCSALGLATTYRKDCRPSRKLVRRLQMLRPTLERLGILPLMAIAEGGGRQPEEPSGELGEEPPPDRQRLQQLDDCEPKSFPGPDACLVVDDGSFYRQRGGHHGDASQPTCREQIEADMSATTAPTLIVPRADPLIQENGMNPREVTSTQNHGGIDQPSVSFGLARTCPLDSGIDDVMVGNSTSLAFGGLESWIFHDWPFIDDDVDLCL